MSTHQEPQRRPAAPQILEGTTCVAFCDGTVLELPLAAAIRFAWAVATTRSGGRCS